MKLQYTITGTIEIDANEYVPAFEGMGIVESEKYLLETDPCGYVSMMDETLSAEVEIVVELTEPK